MYQMMKEEGEGVDKGDGELLIPHASKLIPKGYKVAMRDSGWLKAMQKEFDMLNKNQTWDLVNLLEGRKVFPCKWVLNIRRGTKLLEGVMNKEEDALYKARLVARGDLQKRGMDFKETFAPVVKFMMFQVLMTYAAKMDLECDHWDIISAFLHGKLDMDLYMQ